MNKTLSEQVREFLTKHRQDQKRLIGLFLTVILVLGSTGLAMSLPATTATPELICGQTEHFHNEKCYIQQHTLICKNDKHEHNEACYKDEQVLSCTLKEHQHTKECYKQGSLTSEAADQMNAKEKEPTVSADAVSANTVSENQINETPMPAVKPRLRAAKRRAPAAATEKAQGPYDVAERNWIDNITVQRHEGDKWVELSEFNDGDEVQVEFDFHIPEQTLAKPYATETNRTFIYQLPKGIKPQSKEVIGLITDESSNETIGKITVNDSGQATVVLDETFIKKNEDGALKIKTAFTGKINASDVGEDGKVTFPGTGNTITIRKPDTKQYDVSLEKTGTLADDKKSASYTVTVSTQNGTKASFTISDALSVQGNGVKANYNKDTFKLEKYDASGKLVATLRLNANGSVINPPAGYEGMTVTWNEGKPCFQNVPQLNAGERYCLTYGIAIEGIDQADIESYAVKNRAEVSHNGGNISKEVTFKKDEPSIQKTGVYDYARGEISWTIRILTAGQDFSGWTVLDLLSKYHLEPIGDTYDITLKDKQYGAYYDYFGANTKNSHYEGKFNRDKDIDYVFPALNDEQRGEIPSEIVITFKTKAKDTENASATKVSNKAELLIPGKPNKDSGPAEVGITGRGDWSLDKQYEKEQENDSSDDTLYWKADAHIPDRNLSEDGEYTFTYTDTIKPIILDDTSEVKAKDSHYATLGELKEDFSCAWPDHYSDRGIYLSVDNEDRYVFDAKTGEVRLGNRAGGWTNQSDVTMQIRYVGVDGKEVNPNAPDDTKITQFAVVVKVKKGAKLKSKENESALFRADYLHIGSYRTHLNLSSLEEGHKWTIKNEGILAANGHEYKDDATHEIKKEKTFVKEVDTGKKNDDKSSLYTSDKIKVDYDNGSGVLTYRLLINTKPNMSTVTVEDLLPAGMTLIRESVKARYFENDFHYSREFDDNQPTEYYLQHEGNFNFDDPNYFSCIPLESQDGDPEGSSRYRFKVENFVYKSNYPRIVIRYQVSVNDDAKWNAQETYGSQSDEKSHSQSYINKAKYVELDVEASQETEIERKEEILSKNGKQVLERNVPTGKLRYTIDINPLARKLLNVEHGELVLIDELQKNYQFDLLNPTLDVKNIKLYAYDVTKPDHRGVEMASEFYRIAWDEAHYKLTVHVPDQTACVLVYDYLVDLNHISSAVSLSNSASLDGKWSSKTDFNVHEASAHGSGSAQRKIEFFKVDSENYAKILPNTKFQLQEYADNQWKNKVVYGVTDEKGIITVPASGSFAFYDTQLEADHLYALKETEAVEGYKKSEEPYYFIWRSSSAKDINDIYNAAKAPNDLRNSGKINMLQHVGAVRYIPNEYDRLSVKKVWTDSKGQTVDAPKDASVQVQLYRRWEVRKMHNVKITVHSSNGGNRSDSKVEHVEDGSTIKIVYNNNWWEAYNLTDGPKISFDQGQSWEDMKKTYDNEHGTVLTFYDKDILVNGDLNIDIDLRNIYNLNMPKIEKQAPTNDTAEIREEKVGDPITLSAANTWIYHWEHLPHAIKKDNPYYYYVQEVNGPAGYEVQYRHNGISVGEISIINMKQEESFSLPETGGSGTALFEVLGGLLVLGAGFAFFNKKKMMN